MVDKWTSSSNGESGILRKAHQYNTAENREELLVFGYACKIFRDDEKALSIDKGKHLIPWMGEESLKIDRYDVRATLHDLSQYEAPPGGYTNRMDYLSSAEQKAEQLCEEERYYSLYHNEIEEESYQEEELKRLHQVRSAAFGQVGFNYDVPNTIKLEMDENVEQEEPDVIYTKPDHFDIPTEIVLPNTMKEHAIIEKTATFISTQGPQMEILLKAKQSNNPQFNFLLQNNRLNIYYRHVLDSIKKGLYPKYNSIDNNDKIKMNESDATLKNNNESSIFNYDDSIKYFSSGSSYQHRNAAPTIAYKPSADCSYTQLISKIKGVPLPISLPIDKVSNKSSTIIKDDNSISPTFLLGSDVMKAPPPPPPPTNMKNNTYNGNYDYKTMETSLDKVEVKKISSGLMLAQYYNSDSESESSENDDNVESKINFPTPPEHLQTIIDKTALYVIKNGKSFEEILKTKDPQRFSFLDDSSEYHLYYIYKVTGKIPKVKPNDAKINKTLTPVSFSIKLKDENSVPIKSGLLLEPSSEEDDEKKIIPNDSVNEATKTIPSALDAKLNEGIIHQGTLQITPSLGVTPIFTTTTYANDFKTDIIQNISAIQSTNVPTENERKEARRIAEQRLRDRLAAAAREKLGLLSKEKQLQLERKKKAMAFLNQIKGLNNNQNIVISQNEKLPLPSPPIELSGHLPLHENSENNSDSDLSIHSIPSSPIIMTPQAETEVVKSSRENRKRSISRSTSRSRSKSSSTKHKKKKSKSSQHSKKKSKRKSRSRSRSRDDRSKYDKSHRNKNSSDRDRHRH